MNGVLDWGDRSTDQTHIIKAGYQRVAATETAITKKSKQPEAAVTIHTVQPHDNLKREEESDIPYSEESDEEAEVSYAMISSDPNVDKIINSFEVQFSSFHPSCPCGL